jgi:hypothetical protein
MGFFLIDFSPTLSVLISRSRSTATASVEENAPPKAENNDKAKSATKVVHCKTHLLYNKDNTL